MIDLWALPGPAALVGDLVTHLVEGRQLCLAQEMQPAGLRRALEDVLASRQRQMHLVFDDSGQPPQGLLLRAVSDGIASPEKLSAGIYWVDGITADRGEVWADAVRGVAESSRNLDPWARPLLVVLLPESAAKPRGLDIVDRPTSLLSRLDLEVA